MKETLDLRGLNFEEGYIAVIDKPLSWTSTDVVRKIKSALRRLGYRKIKVGHAGTLDPLATGVLLVCICLLYTSPSPRDVEESRMPSSA